MKKYLLPLILLSAVLGGCKKDNREPPKSTLSGVVVVESSKQAVGVASNGVQLELWQYGYQLFQKIPVYIDQDGSFSAKLFDGKYKLVRLGGAPWEAATDSIDIDLNGSATVEVPVKPFFTIGGETITFNAADTSVTAVFSVNRIDASKNADRVSFNIALTNFVDAQNNQIPIPAATNDKTPGANYLTAPTTIKIPLNPARYPASNQADLRHQLGLALQRGLLFARTGVRTTGVTQRFYTQVKEIALK